MIIKGSLFQENIALYGGAIYSRAVSPKIILENTIFKNNIATYNGGAISIILDRMQ